MKDMCVSPRLLKGIGLIIGGATLLLYTLGILQHGINTILMVAAIIAIGYGIVISGVYDVIFAQIKRLLKK